MTSRFGKFRGPEDQVRLNFIRRASAAIAVKVSPSGVIATRVRPYGKNESAPSIVAAGMMCLAKYWSALHLNALTHVRGHSREVDNLLDHAR